MKIYYEVMLNITTILVIFVGLLGGGIEEEPLSMVIGCASGGFFFSILLYFKHRFGKT